MMEIISIDRWKQRYADVLVNEGGMLRSNARFAADRAIENAGQWATPEDAARDEISHWVAPL